MILKVELNVTNFGKLDVLINFPKDYPMSPPRVLIPRVFHPNVYQKTGALCMRFDKNQNIKVLKFTNF